MSSHFMTSANFTRPSDTTAYTSNDLVANSTTAGSVSPMAFSCNGDLTRVKLKKSTSTNTNAQFTLYLYSSSPTVTAGDNGAYASIEAGAIGSITLDLTGSPYSDACSGFNTFAVAVPCVGPVYGLLKATAGYTPASAEVFTVTLYGV